MANITQYNENHDLAYPVKLGRVTKVSEQGVTAFRTEDLIPHEKMAVIITNRGFIKRVSAHVNRSQYRDGKGIIGMVTREEDAMRLLEVADTHDYLLLFSDRGRIFSIKCDDLPPVSSRTSKGTALSNLFSIPSNEHITDMVVIKEFTPDAYLLIGTRKGEIKKTSLDNFAAVRSNGLICMDVEEGDALIAARPTTENDDVLMVTKKGQSIRFAVSSIRTSQRTSGGVKGIGLDDGDEVIGMGIAYPNSHVLVISTEGYGKRTRVDAYPKQGRAGSSVKTIKLVDKTGYLAGAKIVKPSCQIVIVSANGIVTRTRIKEISVLSRGSQGVLLIKLDSGDKVVSMAVFD